MNPSHASLDELAAGLEEHSLKFIEQPGFRPIALFARDAAGRLQGGISGHINWRWLSISLLWVSPDNRGSGLGSALLKRLESEALTLGCSEAQVDTLGYQAHQFYLANGYAAFAELADYAEGHSRIYLKKSL